MTRDFLSALYAGVAHDNVVRAAFRNGDGRHERDFRFFLQFGNGERAAVAHGVRHLAHRHGNAVVQVSGVRHVAVHAFLKAHAFFAA